MLLIAFCLVKAVVGAGYDLPQAVSSVLGERRAIVTNARYFASNYEVVYDMSALAFGDLNAYKAPTVRTIFSEVSNKIGSQC